MAQAPDVEHLSTGGIPVGRTQKCVHGVHSVQDVRRRIPPSTYMHWHDYVHEHTPCTRWAPLSQSEDHMKSASQNVDLVDWIEM